MIRRFASVRLRVALATVLVVGAALAVGGVALVRLQQRALTERPRLDGTHARA